MKTLFNNKIAIGGLMLIAGIFLGWLLFSPFHEQESTLDAHDHADGQIWTCSMHPSVRQSEPGKCPICGMDLIPLQADNGDDPMEVKMSETAIRLANIQTMTIGVDNVSKEVRLNGKVQPDERNISSQAAHIPGRIEKLLVNFTGEQVRRGSVIAYLYSPELVTAQQELFEANKIKDSQPALFRAAREKLKNWKLNDSQIDEILTSGKPKEQFPIVADASGIVMKRNVSVGDYVSRGMSLYEIVNLSTVWVLFDVYESEMPWVKSGNTIDFTVQSIPGEHFKGKISFIDPVIDPKRRVATARVALTNPGQKLKPEMFATGTVQASAMKSGEITVPKSAVMWTGERSIVYIKSKSDSGIGFRLREVTLGPALSDGFVVLSGLEAGEEIVVNGTFTVDAAAQLAGKPSMMSPDGGKVTTGHQHGDAQGPAPDQSETPKSNDELHKQLRQLLEPYLKVKDALVDADATSAAREAKAFVTALSKVEMKLMGPTSHTAWMPLHDTMKKSAEVLIASKNIDEQRNSFSSITLAYFDVIDKFNLIGLNSYYQFCPMAMNDQGGYWISKEENIRNPYFGPKMMTCGETMQKLN